jgi:hypothetical protein
MQIAQVSDGDKMFEVTTVGALTAGLLSFFVPLRFADSAILCELFCRLPS